MLLKKLTLGLAATAALTFASASSAQQIELISVICDTAANQGAFAARYNEEGLVQAETASIINADGELVEGGLMITADPRNGGFTVFFVLNRNTVCILAAGENFQAVK